MLAFPAVLYRYRFSTYYVLRVKVGLNESAKNSLSQLPKTARFDGFMKSLIGFNILPWGTKIPRRHITFNYSLSHSISSMSNQCVKGLFRLFKLFMNIHE